MNTLNELLSNLKEKSDAGKDANRIIDFIGDMKKKELPETEVMPAEDGKETFTYLGVLRRLDEKLLDSEEPSEDPDVPVGSDKVVVTFKNDDGTLNTTVEVKKGETIGEEPTPKDVEGYVFMGWSTDRYNPEYIVDLATFTTDKDVTLWAMWEIADEEPENPDAPKFTVTFKNDDGSVAGTKEVTANKAVGDGPEPTVEEGYVFMGWSTDRYNPEYIVDLATFTTDKDVTLWAMAEEGGADIIDGDDPVDDNI